MMRYGRYLAACLLCLLAFQVQALGWRDAPWVTQHSRHFSIHGPDYLQHFFLQVAAYAEEGLTLLAEDLDWQPGHRIQLLVVDDTDGIDGWATVQPFGLILINLSPPDDISFLDHDEDWLRALIWHELTHVVHMDQAAGFPAGVRRVLGRQPLMFPHMFQPLWLLEGLAIQYESSEAGRSGRQHSTYYQMRMRAQVEAGLADLSQVSAQAGYWPVDQAYLYGAWFYLFLEETQGEKALQDWLRSYRRLLPGFASLAARRAWGQDFDSLWNAYLEWLKARFEPFNEPFPQGRALTRTGLLDARPVVHQQWVYRIRYDGHSGHQLERYTTDGRRELLGRVDHPGHFDINQQGVLVMAGVQRRIDGRRHADLWRWQQGRGWQRLTEGERYRDVRWTPDGQYLIARKLVAGRSSLHLLTAEGGHLRQLWQGEADEVLGAYSLHPDGQRLVAALRRGAQSWDLHELDLQSLSWRPVAVSAAVYSDPVYSASGRHLLFTAEDGKAYNLYQLDLASGELIRLTRMNTGAFTPIYAQDGGVFFQRYSAAGFDLHYLPESALLSQSVAAVPADWRTPMPEPEAVNVSEVRPYRPWATLRPWAWMPFAQVDLDRAQLGVSVAGQDASLRHAYELTLGYDDLAEGLFGALGYQFDGRYRLSLTRELPERRLDGELDALRSEESLGLARLHLLTADQDRLSLHAGLYLERERDSWLEKDAVRAAATRRSDVGLALEWKRYRGALYNMGGPSAGWYALLIAETHEAGKSDFSGQRYSLDTRYLHHLGASHVAGLRLYAGYAEEEARAWELGGYSDAVQPTYVGRDRYPLRGYGADTFRVQEFAAVTLDYRMPLARIQRSWGVNPVGLDDFYATLFTDHAWLESGSYGGIGLELTLETRLLYWMSLPLSLGYARGLDEELGGSEVWLRLGGAF